MTTPFVHLRAHTEYSITDSALHIDDLIAKAKADGQPAVAMTDSDGMFGAIRFYSKALAQGVKPIIGADVLFESLPPVLTEPLAEGQEAPAPQAPHRALLLCENYEGYLRLMRLISRAYTQNQRKGIPLLREEWLSEEGTEGLVCLSGDEFGLVGRSAVAGDLETAKTDAARWSGMFPGRYFLEIQRRGSPGETEFVQGVVDVADSLAIPLVATHPMQFAEREDYVAHEIKVCDKRKQILHARNRPRDFTPEQHFKTRAEMADLFSDIPEAVENTSIIAQRCSLSIPLGKSVLPHFSTPDGSPLPEYFAKSAREALAKRMVELYPNADERSAEEPKYKQRLEHEISTITQMGFDGYFLIVADFIKWAKEHNVPVGPGRGSGAGSLVAYSFQITDLDPLRYNLLFERFLNPERVSMPDFDIDFCKERRELVVDYVTRKYGADAVAGIANINTLQAKSAIRSTGRVLGMPIGLVDGVAKLVPARPGEEIDIVRALEEEPALRERYDQDPQVRRLLDYAKKIEGLPHAIGQHAAGIIMAPGRITDFTPVYVPEDKIQPVSQYDKDDVEKAGLVKFDFLGLKTLTELDYATRVIKTFPGQEDFELSKIRLDDPGALEIFQEGDTVSVFQFESGGMQKLLRDAHPDRFEDLVALTSLYRPGPMDLIPEYLDCKLGRASVNYLDPRLEPILSETYGVMVYQEQVMQIAQVIGGYTLGGADLLRRAMGKKKPEEMAKHRSIFVDGAAKNGIEAATATKLFDLMEKFAGYGFNKSHAAAYSMISYQTAYIKKTFPSAFYSAWLTIEGQENTDSIPPLIADAAKRGLEILPPDINKSQSIFSPSPEDPTKLRYGLLGLKGLGADAAAHIEQTRKQQGEFTDLLDFCKKIGKGYLNRKGIEILVKSGAFDSLHPNRSEAIAYLPKALKYLDEVARRDRKIGAADATALDALFRMKPKDPEPQEPAAQATLDGMEAPVAPAKPARKTKAKAPKEAPPMPDLPVWETLPELTLIERLTGEKDVFGFYFSGHPFTHYQEQLGGVPGRLPLEDAPNVEPGWDQHWIAGVIQDVKPINSKKGKMAKVTVSDGKGVLEVTVFSDLYDSAKDILKTDQFILFAAMAKEDNFRGGIGFTAEAAKDFNQTRALLADDLNVAIPLEKLAKAQEIAAKHPGDLPLLVWHPNGDSYVKSTEPVMKINLSSELIDELSAEFGERYVKTRIRRPLPAPIPKKKKSWARSGSSR